MGKSFKDLEKYGEYGYMDCASQLKDFIFRKHEQMLDMGDEMRSKISSLKELEQYNSPLKERFVQELGGLIEVSSPLNAKITAVHDMGDFVLENIVFQSRPNTYVTSSMYIPKGITYPAPAVLYLCGHSIEGRMYDVYTVVCQILAKAGLIVFAMDPLGQGERSNYYDPETGTYLEPREVFDHNSCGAPGVGVGKYLERYFLCDQMRAVDYMLTRPEIDPKRIGVTGCSGGGTQTVSMMICDDRIAAAAPATFVTTRREIMYTGAAQDMEQIWPACAAYGFDHVNVFMLFAPKPAAILGVTSDYFPIEGGRETYKEAKRFYGLYGKESNVRMYEVNSWHAYTPELAACAAEFFSEVFLGEKKKVDIEGIDPIPEELFYVTKSGNVLGEIEDAQPLQANTRIIAEKMRLQRLALPESVRKERAKQWLAKKVMNDRDVVSPNLRLYAAHFIKEVDGGYVTQRVSWRTQKRLFCGGMLIRQKALADMKKLPTVIAIWNDGTKQIGSYEDWIRRQCDAGKQVLVLDVPGFGNTEQYNFAPPFSYKGMYGPIFRLCCDLITMGDSLAALHCYDVIRTIEMMDETYGISEDDITLYCDGDEGVYGVMAGFLKEKVKVECGEKLLLSVEKSIIVYNGHIYKNALGLMIPGMLQYFDYEELL